MKASELIKALQNKIDEHGDIMVTTSSICNSEIEITKVECYDECGNAPVKTNPYEIYIT